MSLLSVHERHKPGVARMPARAPEYYDGENGDIPRWRGIQHETHRRQAVAYYMDQGLNAHAIAADPTLSLNVRQFEYLMSRISLFG